MLQFTVALIRNFHRGLAVDEKRASPRYRDKIEKFYILKKYSKSREIKGWRCRRNLL
jgi:hypothetical protein